MSDQRRLIDANALIERFRVVAQSGGAVTYHVSDICAAIEDEAIEAPVDAEEVVRCKDCKHCSIDLSGRNAHLCLRKEVGFVVRRKLDDFCSYGERKEERA